VLAGYMARGLAFGDVTGEKTETLTTIVEEEEIILKVRRNEDERRGGVRRQVTHLLDIKMNGLLGAGHAGLEAEGDDSGRGIRIDEVLITDAVLGSSTSEVNHVIAERVEPGTELEQRQRQDR
jgi:hypothetical protein